MAVKSKTKLRTAKLRTVISPLTVGQWYHCPFTGVRFKFLGDLDWGVDVIDEYGERRVVGKHLWIQEMTPCRPPRPS